MKIQHLGAVAYRLRDTLTETMSANQDNHFCEVPPFVYWQAHTFIGELYRAAGELDQIAQPDSRPPNAARKLQILQVQACLKSGNPELTLALTDYTQTSEALQSFAELINSNIHPEIVNLGKENSPPVATSSLGEIKTKLASWAALCKRRKV